MFPPMTDSRQPPPDLGGNFLEVELSFDGSMEDEILRIVIEALNQQGYPDLDRASLASNNDHREAALDMLGDCRPLPVVRALIDKIRRHRL